MAYPARISYGPSIGASLISFCTSFVFFFYYVLTSLHSFCFSNTLPCFHLCALLLLFFLPGFPCSWCGSSFSLFRSQVKCVSQSLFLTSISNPVLTAFTLSLCIPLPYLIYILPNSPIRSWTARGYSAPLSFCCHVPNTWKGPAIQ